jgi:hypothetical protein
VFSRRWKRTLREVRDLLDTVERRTDKMETVLIVREPSSQAAAEAYEGLRKQLISTVDERRVRLSQLVELDIAVDSGASRDTLAALAGAWLREAGVERVWDPHHPQADRLFDIAEGGGGELQVTQAAYVNVLNGQVIQRGRVRRRAVRAEPTATRPVAAEPVGPVEPVEPVEPADVPRSRPRAPDDHTDPVGARPAHERRERA